MAAKVDTSYATPFRERQEALLRQRISPYRRGGEWNQGKWQEEWDALQKEIEHADVSTRKIHTHANKVFDMKAVGRVKTNLDTPRLGINCVRIVGVGHPYDFKKKVRQDDGSMKDVVEKVTAHVDISALESLLTTCACRVRCVTFTNCHLPMTEEEMQVVMRRAKTGRRLVFEKCTFESLAKKKTEALKAARAAPVGMAPRQYPSMAVRPIQGK